MSMRVFESVIEKGSFAAAARALDLSPAVVTRLVADLEEHLGTRLLQRSTRRMSLTDAGEAYVDRLRQILHDIDDADAEVSTHAHQLAGELHISSPPVVATYLLAPLIAGFRQRYPNIVFDVHVVAIDAPSIEEYDLTLLAVGDSYNGSVIARKIAMTSAILVASPEYLKQNGVPQQPQDLTAHSCLRLRLPGLRSPTWRLMHSEPGIEDVHIPVTPVLWVNHTDTLLRAALDGAGITSIAQDLVAPYVASGELVRVLRPWITGHLSVFAAFPSRKFMPRRTRLFLDYLTEQAQKMVEVAKDCC